MSILRPAIGSALLSALVAAYLLAVTNFTFWGKASAFFADKHIDLVVLAIVVLLLHFAFLLSFSIRYLMKPLFILFIMVAAGSSYFVDTFGIMIDREMIQNAAQTTATESSHLLTPNFILHMLLFGVLPSLLVAWARIVYQPFWRRVRVNTLVVLGCLAASVGLIASDLSTYVPFWQREREVTMSYLNPAMSFGSTIDYGLRQFLYRNIVAKPYGEDARQGPRLMAAKKKMLTVLVVGETARAQNFSLAGYARDTNPELARRGVIAMRDVTSCGTSTAVSMPCMFSHLGRADYSKNAALGSENLLDVLQHAGLKVAWWENNTGPKSISDRVPTLILNDRPDDAFCLKGECLDQILLDRLDSHIADVDGNAVIVLHMMGSHGPAYFQRYTEDFRKFRPDCRTPELSTCSHDELLNAYDNTVLYTDYFLARVIDILKANSGQFATSMIYISDHGESLGEDGLYLHGAPYAFAPETQTRVPFITWFSDEFAGAIGLDLACARAGTARPVSHDNMFDTVLGMMNVETKVYDPSLDVFAACRKDSAVSG